MILQTPKFPLWALLTIYAKAERECYINYMAGFKALTSWLGPIDIPTKYSSRSCPDMLITYEIQEIAVILGCNPCDVLYTLYNETLPILEIPLLEQL